jgi:hypothetical protein
MCHFGRLKARFINRKAALFRHISGEFQRQPMRGE